MSHQSKSSSAGEVPMRESKIWDLLMRIWDLLMGIFSHPDPGRGEGLVFRSNNEHLFQLNRILIHNVRRWPGSLPYLKINPQTRNNSWNSKDGLYPGNENIPPPVKRKSDIKELFTERREIQRTYEIQRTDMTS